MRVAEGDHALREIVEICLVRAEVVVEPVANVVEVLWVVVAAERPQIFIAGAARLANATSSAAIVIWYVIPPSFPMRVWRRTVTISHP
jgi:hypothetical protein